MSTYFDALMRSTGLTIGAPPGALAHAGPGIVEIDVEHANRVEAAVEPLERAPADRAIETREEPRPAIDPIEASPNPSPSDSQASEPTPDLGQTLIRAAMKWVAADATPAHSGDTTPVVARPDRPSRPPGTASGPTSIAPSDATRPSSKPATGTETLSTPSLPDRVVTVPGPTTNASLAAETPVPEPRTPVAAPARTIAKATPAAASPVVDATKGSANERIEVSIGAINIRVDAPAPQTVAEPAPPSRTARTAAPARARSALSRRALRRI